MKQLLVACAAAALAFGCSNDEQARPNSKTETVKSDAKPADKAAAPIEYHEVSAKGRLYVLGSKASADKAKAGQLPVIATTKVGHGPNGETVVFEADAKSDLDKKLMVEYEKKHPKK
jgi:hypothetical protein